MDFKSTFTSDRRRAFTLVEMLVAVGLAGIACLVIMSFLQTSALTFVSLTNYSDLGLKTQIAVDKISKDIRQCAEVKSYQTNTLTLRKWDGTSMQYAFDPATRTLSRISGANSALILTECDYLRFWIYQRTPMSNAFECYAPAQVSSARLITVTLSCSRKMLGPRQSTEVVQSANVALRNHP